MGTAIPTILTEDFKENDVIVIDDDSRREFYLHDELINTFRGRLVIQETAPETTLRRPTLRQHERIILRLWRRTMWKLTLNAREILYEGNGAIHHPNPVPTMKQPRQGIPLMKMAKIDQQKRETKKVDSRFKTTNLNQNWNMADSTVHPVA